MDSLPLFRLIILQILALFEFKTFRFTSLIIQNLYHDSCTGDVFFLKGKSRFVNKPCTDQIDL